MQPLRCWKANVNKGAKRSGRTKVTMWVDLSVPCRELGMTPHVASREKGSRIDGRTTNHLGYEISQRKRKRVEEPFGWMKTFGLLRKLRHRGEPKVDWLFRFTATAYNITRLHGLTA